MKVGFGQYIRAAFNARPAGMFVPPNWVMLGLFGFLGFIEPGLWAIGAGLEMGYLYVMAMNPRFQRTVVGSQLLENRQEQISKQRGLIAQLNPDDQEMYFNLERRCQAILRQQGQGGGGGG